MGQLAVSQRLDERAGAGAHEQALAKLEMLAEEIDAAVSRQKSNGLVRRAIKAWHRGDVVRASQLSLQATNADETNAQAYHLLAMALERMGHMHKALVTYEQAFRLDPTDPDLFLNLGLSAWNMKLIDGAAGMFRQYIDKCPTSPLGYNNLGMIECEQGKTSIAIETLRSAIYRMPEESILWNSLGTVLAEEGRAEESLTFYMEAIRLEPEFSRPYHNIGYALSHLGRLEEALDAYDHALKFVVHDNERIEGDHSRSICLIGMGRLEEGFRDYEVRHNPRFRGYVHHMTNAPLWHGEDLHGKRILVVAEQGLGDELMFANVLPDIARAVGENGKLQIAVDPRLVPLFARSFLKAEVGAYDDRQMIDPDGAKELRFIPWAAENGEPDFYAPGGTPLQYLRKRVEDFPKERFLTPDPERVAQYRKRLEALGPGPYVGVCWRSMMIDVKRKKYYSALDLWGPVLNTPNVTFVNVQYGDVKDELAAACAKHGVAIHNFDDLDLKNDLDGAAALSAALDLVISAPTAAAAMAGSVGTPLWFLSAGRTWPQLGTDHYPWYRDTRAFRPEAFGDWKSVMKDAGEALAVFVQTRTTENGA